MRHNLRTRIEAVELFIMCQNNYDRFLDNWKQPMIAPSKKTMNRLIHRFRTSGNLTDVKRSGRKKMLDENSITAVGAYFSINQNASIKSFMEDVELDVSKTTVWRTLRHDLKLKPFRPRRVHRLLVGDDKERYWCLHKFMELMKKQPTFVNSIIWSDECSMKLNGTITTNNVVSWSECNPHLTYQRSTNRNGVMVFAAISIFGVIAIGFFDEMTANDRRAKKNSVNKASYQEMLEKHLLPSINDFYPESERSSIYFMQDGAPSHNIPEFLDRHFNKRWIGNSKHRAPLQWPSRSPDLTPMGLTHSAIFVIFNDN